MRITPLFRAARWDRVPVTRTILRIGKFLRALRDGDVIVLSPVVPFFLLIGERITLLAALFFTVAPIVVHHFGKSDE